MGRKNRSASERLMPIPCISEMAVLLCVNTHPSSCRRRECTGSFSTMIKTTSLPRRSCGFQFRGSLLFSSRTAEVKNMFWDIWEVVRRGKEEVSDGDPQLCICM